LIIVDNLTGNYDVLLANIGILTASSFALTVGHLRQAVSGFIIAFLLGIAFLLNQLDELASTTNLAGVEALSIVLVCFSTHLSHLLLSLVFFVRGILRCSSSLISDS